MERTLLATAAAAMAACSLSAHARDVIPENERFTPESTIEAGVQSGVIGGLAFSFHHEDGSGTFQGTEGASLGGASAVDGTNWSVSCNGDSMTDRVTCRLHRGNLWVTVLPSKRSFVSVGHDHFPGTRAVVRVDNGRARQTAASGEGDFDASTSAAIISELKAGHKFRTRYVKWPSQAWVEGEELALGFAQAYSYVTWAVTVGNRPAAKAKAR